MRKSLLLLFLLLTFSSSLFSQNEEVIKITLIDKTENNSKVNHAPSRPQIECFYYYFSSIIEISFLSNLGSILISLENNNTGEMQDYVCNSSSGRMIMSVVSNTTYRMEIITENGHNYYTVFFTGCEVDD